jgi:carbamoyl-phosphate synthase small subunit
VKNLATGQVEVTAQNHGFSVDPALFEQPQFELTHVNLNDGTVEGFRHRELPVMSVQYHPEASPGPHDSHYLFGDFIRMMEARRR